MIGSARRPGAWRRWAAVLAGVGVLVALPPAVARLPAAESSISASQLLARIRASGTVAHDGYAESTARLSLPDVRQAGDALRLLGERTALRVWWAGPLTWRVDDVSPVGERDTYRDPDGTWLWESLDRRATRVDGEPQVRLVRAPDLAPIELGRRLTASARPDEVLRLPARRVAGRSVPGIRVTPRDPETTVGRVDVWADERTGVPVLVSVTARGAAEPLLETLYLDLHIRPQPAARFTFVPPRRARVEQTAASDAAQEVDRYSPFVVPETLDDRPRRTAVGTGAGTYGDGYAVVAVLTLPAGRVQRAMDRLDGPLTPTITGLFGDGKLLATPLINGLLVIRDDVGYVLAGTVNRAVLERVATDLVSRPPVSRHSEPVP